MPPRSQDSQLDVAVLRFKLDPRAELSEAFLYFPHTGAHFSNVLVDYLYLVMFPTGARGLFVWDTDIKVLLRAVFGVCPKEGWSLTGPAV